MGKKKKKTNLSRNTKNSIRKRKRAEKKIDESKKKLLERARNKAGNDFELVSKKTEKMSEVILDFAEPLLDFSEDSEDQRKSISIAIIAWNLSLLPEGEQKTELANVRNHIETAPMGNSLSEDEFQIFAFMIDRKEKYFQNYKRMILDYEMVDTPQGLHLNVVSNVDDK